MPPRDSRRNCGPETAKSYVLYQKRELTLLDSSGKRHDGRQFGDVRPIFLKTGVVSQAKGSAYVEMGNTKVVCSVYGPREIARRKDFTYKGQINCEFRFAQYSCQIRRQHLNDSEALHFSQLLEEALAPVVCLHKFPKSTVDVFVYVLENDGGALASAITTAGLALADAGIDMYDVVIGCSLRQDGSTCLLDPTYREETAPVGAENIDRGFGRMTLAFMPALQQVAALVQDGDLDAATVVSDLRALMNACHEIYPLVQDVLIKDLEDKLEGDMKKMVVSKKKEDGVIK
uniref:Exosome complex component MTR3 n=1 Tax=Amblyomma triste TaxID=251400 RepID=A0A023GHI3_AMBTT